MTTLKRLLALLTAAALCLALCACKDTTGEESGAPVPSGDVSAEPGDTSSAEPSAEIVADLSQPMYEFCSGLKDGDAAVTVNGTPVSNQYFLYWLSNYCYNVAYNSYMYYGMSMDFSDEELRKNLLDSTKDAVVYHVVLRELCQELDVTVTQEQQQELQDQIDEMGLEDILLNLGVDEETFHYIAENNYLFTNYAEKLMGEPTEADLEKYVADQKIYRVKHILLKTVDDSRQPLEDSVIAEKKAQAEDLLSQLQAEDADGLEAKFDELMNELSEDGRNEDGTLAAPDGYTAGPGEMVSAFEEASLALEVGGLSGIVESEFGYHIILRLPIDVGEYEEDWYSDGADAAIAEAMDAAEVTVADAITALDVNDFYNRYMAYGSALYDEMYPAESAEPTQEPSGPEPVPEE